MSASLVVVLGPTLSDMLRASLIIGTTVVLAVEIALAIFASPPSA
jgi:hypothetical protein